MKNSIKQRAITVVHALTDAAIRMGEMNCDDEGYMRDLDEAKVDAVLAVCGRRSQFVKAVLKSQREAHSKPFRIGSSEADLERENLRNYEPMSRHGGVVHEADDSPNT